MLHAELGNSLKQRFRLVRVSKDPCLDPDEQLAAAALDHVTKQSPRRPAEANQWHPASELSPRKSDGLVHVVQRLGHFDRAVHDFAVLRVLWRLQRIGKVGALLVHHDDLHAHGLRDDQDVGEDDGGVEKALIAVDGLQRERRRDLGRPAALEEVMIPFGLMVLREIATSCTVSACIVGETAKGLTLAHHPHGRAMDSFAYPSD